MSSIGDRIPRFVIPLTNRSTDFTMNIRVFIAIHLPNKIKNALGEVALSLNDRVPRGAIRWVRPEQMHLTLRFLGDTDTAKLPAVQAAMDAVAASNAPFEMRLGGVGCFPNRNRPRVIWVGLSGEEARLLSLVAALEKELAHLGWEPEGKPFRAHLTLGRVKDERGAQGIEWAADVQPLVVPIEAIHLIESQLRPTGPVYTLRHSSRLALGR